MKNHLRNQVKIDAMFFTATEEPLKILGEEFNSSEYKDQLYQINEFSKLKDSEIKFSDKK